MTDLFAFIACFFIGVIVGTMCLMLRTIESPPNRVDWTKIFVGTYILFCFVLSVFLVTHGAQRPVSGVHL